MGAIPTLDAHAHLASKHSSDLLKDSGYVLAMALSLNEADAALKRSEPFIVWGVGCHPRIEKAQATFDADQFRELARLTPVIGEIGLDTGSRVPLEIQLRNFRKILEIIAYMPRFVSIHSYHASGLILEELRRVPISTPVLHWWTGTAQETSTAVDLGCYFSIHSAVARHSKFRTRVPPERILVESDHGYGDPPAAIPCRIEWVEHLVAQQLGINVRDVRWLVWMNFSMVIQANATLDLLPEAFREIILSLSIQTHEQFTQAES